MQVQVLDKDGNKLFDDLNAGPRKGSARHAKAIGKGVASQYPRAFKGEFDKETGVVVLKATKPVAKGDVEGVKDVVEQTLASL